MRFVGETMAQRNSNGLKATEAANVGSGMVASAATWLAINQGISLGPALTKLLAGIGFVIGLFFAMVYRRYAVIITRRGPQERAAYDSLRRSLAQGGLPARIYSERLQAILDAVDRFFGDADMAHRTLFPSAFGLRKPAPLWTTAAYDRCLLLALLYPIAVVFIGWTASGHVGPAENAWNLLPNVPFWQRASAFAAVVGGLGIGWYIVADLFLPACVRPRPVWAACLIVATIACAFAAVGAFGGAFHGSRRAAVPSAVFLVGWLSMVGRAFLSQHRYAGTITITVLVLGLVNAISLSGYGQLLGICLGALGFYALTVSSHLREASQASGSPDGRAVRGCSPRARQRRRAGGSSTYATGYPSDVVRGLGLPWLRAR